MGDDMQYWLEMISFSTSHKQSIECPVNYVNGLRTAVFLWPDSYRFSPSESRH